MNVSAEIEDLIIPVGSKDPARATTDIWFACNLDKATPRDPGGATAAEIEKGTWQTSFDIFDSFGRVHKLRADFQRVPGVANRWQVDVTVDPDAPVGTNTAVDVGAANNAGNRFFVDFDNFGTLSAVRDAQGDVVNAGAAAGRAELRRPRHDPAPRSRHGAADLQHERRRGRGLQGRGHAVRRGELDQGVPAERLRHGLPRDLQDRPGRRDHRRLHQRIQPDDRAGRAGHLHEPGRAREGGREHLREVQQLGRREHRAVGHRRQGQGDRRHPRDVQRGPRRRSSWT